MSNLRQTERYTCTMVFNIIYHRLCGGIPAGLANQVSDALSLYTPDGRKDAEIEYGIPLFEAVALIMSRTQAEKGLLERDHEEKKDETDFYDVRDKINRGRSNCDERCTSTNNRPRGDIYAEKRPVM